MKPFRSDLAPLLLMAVIIGGVIFAFWKLLDVVVIAVSLAVVLYPLQQYCNCCVNRYTSAALVTALVLVISFTSVILSYTIISQNSEVIRGIVDTIQNWVQNPATDPRLYGFPFERLQVAGWFDQAEALFVKYWYTITSDLPTIALKTVLFFSTLYVFLLHGMQIRERIAARIPADLNGYTGPMSGVTVDTLYAIYVVHLGITVLTFVLAVPFFIFLGYGNVLFYSFLCAFCELIPVLGSSVVFLFLAIYALSIGDINSVLLLFFIGYLCVSVFPEVYVRPVLMGRRVKLHPIIMLVGFYGGLITMGMAGFILGPVLIVLLFTGYNILIEKKKDSVYRDTGEETS